MTAYSVQFVLPVDNPTNNVRRRNTKQCIHFEVPLNYPDAHNVTLAELLMAAEHSGLLAVSTPLNTDNHLTESRRSISRAVNKTKELNIKKVLDNQKPF